MSATATSDWPTPTVSITITSNPAASHSSPASRVRRATPPSDPPEGEGRMKASGSRARRSMRVLSPMIEPPLRRLDGSTASTATRCPAAVSRVPSSSMNVDLPEPGVPLTPTRTALPVAGSTSSSRRPPRPAASGRVDSINVIERANARRSPARSRSARSPMTLKLQRVRATAEKRRRG